MITTNNGPVKKPVVKRVVRKQQNKPVVSSSVTSSMTAKEINDILEKNMTPTYTIKHSPRKWPLSNRAIFNNWLDVNFKKYEKKKSASAKKDCVSCDESCVKPHLSTVQLFPHQDFVKDYIQFDSPYRGILLYHGLGSGKSCSAIAAAEILYNHMKVVIMTPASLRDNYINEIKKCGKLFFGLKQHWVFIPEMYDEAILKKIHLSRDYITKNGGFWIPIPDQQANFESLKQQDRNMISQQIDHIIENSFEFINYNGLNRNKISQMIENGNPFDGKCIVIDEIHNLISVIRNGGMIGSDLYKLLMKAKGAKLILLSGTPIINYPSELAFLINLLTGYRTLHELKFSKDNELDSNAIKEILNKNKYVDTYEIDVANRKITLSWLPDGFGKVNGILVARDRYTRKSEEKHAFIDDDSKVELLIQEFKDIALKLGKRHTSKTVVTLPEKENDFNSYFIDFNTMTVKNPLMFMRRILGTVSYYNSYSSDLYPSVTKHDVPLYLNDFQFGKYEKARGEERKKERTGKKGKVSKDNPFAASGQVYRFYSRAICNFVFPENIERPFPSKISQMKKEVDDFDDTITDIEKDEKADKGDFQKEYMELVNQALKELKNGNYLEFDEVEKYSPKYKSIFDKISTVNGSALVYSQFRKVEGLGVFGMFLEKNGYAEFKIKKVNDQWDIDIVEEDYSKPKYIAFTGSNEETRILLNIFNSNLAAVPQGIRDKLDLLGGKTNMRGNLIKVLMITKSGAEGISLKNVRQVHIMEPYWNHVRLDQVIGRAVRTCSHIDLPKDERHVDVYVYYMVSTKKQIADSFSIRTQDKSMTSDEFIYTSAKNKANIVNGFLDLMKTASVDCAKHASKHGNLRCFSFPVNISEDKVIFESDIARELEDSAYLSQIEKNEWKGEIMVTKKGSFLIRRETNEVYDYDIYIDSGKLVKVGELIKEHTKTIIKKHSN